MVLLICHFYLSVHLTLSPEMPAVRLNSDLHFLISWLYSKYSFSDASA